MAQQIRRDGRLDGLAHEGAGRGKPAPEGHVRRFAIERGAAQGGFRKNLERPSQRRPYQAWASRGCDPANTSAYEIGAENPMEQSLLHRPISRVLQRVLDPQRRCTVEHPTDFARARRPCNAKLSPQ